MTTQSEAPAVEARCMRCRQQRRMDNPEQGVMKNGRPVVRGTCVICGTKMNRIGSMPTS